MRKIIDPLLTSRNCVVSQVIYSHVVNDIVPQKYGFNRFKTINLMEFAHFVSLAMDSRLHGKAVCIDLTKTVDCI